MIFKGEVNRAYRFVPTTTNYTLHIL